MFLKTIAAVSLITLAAPAQSAEAAPQAALTALLAEENRLAEAAALLPPVEGIATMLAEDARVYARSGPFKGRSAALEGLKANPLNAGKKANWHSVKSGISGDGTHGFTAGYLDIDGGDPRAARRRYLAYWVKGAEGWRVAAFKQAPRAAEEKDIAALPQSIPAHAGHHATPDPASARSSLIAAEKAFSDQAQVVGVGRAFAENGRPDAINNGPDGFKLGAAAIGAAVSGGSNEPSPINWSADDVLVAPSGDLGITFGLIRPNEAPPAGQPAGAPFFTIWMRDGPDQPWRYVAE
ncbi:MAG: nuclear transport factor 2 family protein [Sphingomicrobium sp.]